MKKIALFIVTIMTALLLVACGSKTFQVKFDSNGGTPTPETQVIKKGGKVASVEQPTKNGEVFTGWFNEDSRWRFDVDTVTKDLVLKAKWRVDEDEVKEPTFEGLEDVNYVMGMDEPNYLEGVIVRDYEGTDITDLVEIDSSLVDLEKVGVYTVVLKVKDSFGNEVIKTIKVSVFEKDESAPVVSGLPNEYRVEVGTKTLNYLEGVKAIDNVDGDITEKISVNDSEVNLEKEGIYNVTIKVTDTAGNVFETRLSVIVLPDLEDFLLDLDLGGEEIVYFTHVETDDNPFMSSYDGDFKEEYKEHLEKLQEKYNFTLKFVPLSDYSERQRQISQYVQGNSNSAIVRIPELDFMIDLLSANLLSDFTDISSLLSSTYSVNDWQVRSGKINNKTYAIQNKDGNLYQDLLVYNKELLSQAGISETPAESWQKGEWTYDKMESMLETIKNNESLAAAPLGITPYHVGMYAPAANGAEFVSKDGKLNLTNTQTLNSITKYKNWDSKGYLANIDFSNSDLKKQDAYGLWSRQEAVFGVGMMWQLDGFKSDFEYGVVPFPQENNKSKDDYYTPVGAVGDKLSITKGSNSDDVASILFLINDFFREKRIEELNAYQEIYPNLTLEDLRARRNVETYLSLTNEEEIKLAMDIFKFLQGEDSYEAIENDSLAYLNGEKDYINAVRIYFDQGGTVRNHIDSIIPIIENKIEAMLEAINRNK